MCKNQIVSIARTIHSILTLRSDNDDEDLRATIANSCGTHATAKQQTSCLATAEPNKSAEGRSDRTSMKTL
jgi:hypothetical protein